MVIFHKLFLNVNIEGIGRALIARLHKDGAQVFTVEKDPEHVSKLKNDFPGIVAEIVDITKWNEVQEKVKSLGSLDHLVNNAGTLLPHDILTVTEQEVDFMINLNLKSVITVSQAVAKEMIAGNVKGTIVNIASIAAHISTANSTVYGTTKAGILMLTKCLARELGPYGIRCNSVSPTGVDTPMYHKVMEVLPPADDAGNFMSRQPLQGKTVLDPDEVVNSILFLLSPLSSMATGTDLLLDGGISAC